MYMYGWNGGAAEIVRELRGSNMTHGEVRYPYGMKEKNAEDWEAGRLEKSPNGTLVRAGGIS